MATVKTIGLWEEKASYLWKARGLRSAKAWNKNGLRDRKREKKRTYTWLARKN